MVSAVEQHAVWQHVQTSPRARCISGMVRMEPGAPEEAACEGWLLALSLERPTDTLRMGTIVSCWFCSIGVAVGLVRTARAGQC